MKSWAAHVGHGDGLWVASVVVENGFWAVQIWVIATNDKSWTIQNWGIAKRGIVSNPIILIK